MPFAQICTNINFQHLQKVFGLESEQQDVISKAHMNNIETWYNLMKVPARLNGSNMSKHLRYNFHSWVVDPFACWRGPWHVLRHLFKWVNWIKRSWQYLQFTILTPCQLMSKAWNCCCCELACRPASSRGISKQHTSPKPCRKPRKHALKLKRIETVHKHGSNTSNVSLKKTEESHTNMTCFA